MNKEQLDLLLKLINKKIRSENLSKFVSGDSLMLPLTEDSEKIDINYLMGDYIGMLIGISFKSAYKNNGNLTIPENTIASKLVDMKQYIIETIGEKDYKSIIMIIPNEIKYERNIFRIYISFDYSNDNLYFELTTKDKVIQLTCDFNYNDVDFRSIVTDRDSQVINLDSNSVVPQSVEPQSSSRYLPLNMSNKNYVATLNSNATIELIDDRISIPSIDIDNDNIEISLVVKCNTDVLLSFSGFSYMLEENSSCNLQTNYCYNIIIKRGVDAYLIKIDKYITLDS